MPALNQIVDIIITRQTKGITQKGFGTPMVLGLHTKFSERIRYYDSMDGVAADFVSSDAEFVMANAIFSQRQQPPRIAIGRRTAVIAQVVTVAVSVVANNHAYVITLGGVAYTFTSDGSATGAEIQAGLIAAVAAGFSVHAVTASAGGGTDVVLTASVAGNPFSYAVDVDLTAVLTTPNHGAAEDIAAVQAESDDWYMLIMTSRNDADILSAAGFIETQEKMYVACNAEAGVLTSVTNDIMSLLKAKNYDRSFYLYSADQVHAPEAAWAGLDLPYDPGSETWMFKNLVGIISDNLSASAQQNAKAKNANTYEPFAGVDITRNGVVASGEYIDIIRGSDWLKSRMQERIYGILINSAKIPYTDAGVAVFENAVRAQLQEGKKKGLLNPDFESIITVPKVKDVNPADKQARVLNQIEFEDEFAGAIHKVKVRGQIIL